MILQISNLKVAENSFLVTMNGMYTMHALYTNIPNNEGNATVKRKHDNYTKKTVAKKVITTFLVLILTLNNFCFNSKSYLQIKGCTMGTICAPTEANIFISEFEERYISSIFSLKTNPGAICASSTIFLWYGPNQKTILNPSQMKQVKNFIPQNLTLNFPEKKMNFKTL